MFGVVCYGRVEELSNLAMDLLLSDVEKDTDSEKGYVPPPHEIRGVFQEYNGRFRLNNTS